MLTLGSQRRLFDVPAGVAYFNTAYNSPLLNTSRAALVAAAQAKSHPWERPPADFFADAERIRELAASLFGGEADGYAIVPAASYGLSAAARAIQPMLKTGDRIVVPDDEFPSNVLPWRRVAEEARAVVTTVTSRRLTVTLGETDPPDCLARSPGPCASTQCRRAKMVPLAVRVLSLCRRP